MPDRYELETHYYPALLSSAPFFLLGYYFLSGLDGEFLSHAATAAVGGIGVSAALYWLQISACRTAGKLIEDKVFESGSKMPTTELMMEADGRLSPEMKNSIVKRLNKDFSIDLAGRLEEGPANRTLINEAVGQIRTKLGRNNPLVSQRNRQYGFARNALGGSLIAIIASLIGLGLSYLTNNAAALQWSVVFLVGYSLLATVMWLLLKFLGFQYAIALYDEYLASD